MDLSLIIFGSGIVFGGACGILAANKNRDPLGWFALGFFFSIVTNQATLSRTGGMSVCI